MDNLKPAGPAAESAHRARKIDCLARPIDGEASNEDAPRQVGITLRPYQQDAIDRIRRAYSAGIRRVLYVAPTGSGKTIIFTFIASSATRKAKRVLVLAHRAEIIDQISSALAAMDVAHGVIAPGSSTKDPVQLASVATRLNLVAALRGYKPGWVFHRLAEARERQKGAAA